MLETTTQTDATSELKELFKKNRDTLVGTFGFDEEKFNQICKNLNSLKNCLLRNQFIQNISLAIGDITRKEFVNLTDSVEKKKLNALLDNIEQLAKIISILETHNIPEINKILSDVISPDNLENDKLKSLSVLSAQVDLLKRFIKEYPNNNSYTHSIALLLFIRKFDNDHIINDCLRNALTLIFQCYAQLNVVFDVKLFEELKKNQEAIQSLDNLYSLRGVNDALPVQEMNDILSGLSKNSPANSERKTLTSPQEAPNASPSEVQTNNSLNQNQSIPITNTLLAPRTTSNISSVLLPYKSNASSLRSSKIALATGLGLMAAGAVLAVFSAFALAGTGGLSSVLSAAGLFASYKMIMTGILLAVGTETFFLGEKAMSNNCACNCASFFGKKSAPAAAAVSYKSLH